MKYYLIPIILGLLCACDNHSSAYGDTKNDPFKPREDALKKDIIGECLAHDYRGLQTNSYAIGTNAVTRGACDVAVGPNTFIPASHPDYFVNIGNKRCWDLRSGDRLDCKTGRELFP